MKSKLLPLLTLVAIILVSCTKDDPKKGSGSETEEESVVTLTIYDGMFGTRAAGAGTDTATPVESAIDVSLEIKVVVFNENGTQSYPQGGPLTLSITEEPAGSGIYQSEEFTVTSGKKYFYIFANDSTPGFISIPSATTNRNEFIKRLITVTLDGTDELNIQNPNFLMGTLWSEKKTAPGGGVPGSPEEISLTIGRLASKVTLNGVNKGTSTMQGAFSDPEYRLGTIPKKIFYIGNNDESSATPPASGHGVVVSAVHLEPPYTGTTDPNYQQYTSTWKNVSNTTPESFYTVENTTLPDDDGIQYYGNTSYIQIRTTYTPAISEVYNVEDLTPKGSFTGPTFYTATLLSTGVRVIFEDDPRTGGALTPDEDIDQNSIQVYTNGLNYHKFPIHDPETGLPDVQKNAVLRNHSYYYTVTSIADIGSPDVDVDPVEPVENETTLEIQVRIAPWYKIENNNVPI